MDAKLTELLTWLQTTTEGATEFAVEQAPLVAQELLRYRMATAIFLLVLGGLLVAFAIFAIGHGCHIWVGESEADGFSWFVGSIITFVMSVPLLVAGTLELLKLTLAPRVYVLEWVMAKIGG